MNKRGSPIRHRKNDSRAGNHRDNRQGGVWDAPNRSYNDGTYMTPNFQRNQHYRSLPSNRGRYQGYGRSPANRGDREREELNSSTVSNGTVYEQPWTSMAEYDGAPTMQAPPPKPLDLKKQQNRDDRRGEEQGQKLKRSMSVRAPREVDKDNDSRRPKITFIARAKKFLKNGKECKKDGRNSANGIRNPDPPNTSPEPKEEKKLPENIPALRKKPIPMQQEDKEKKYRLLALKNRKAFMTKQAQIMHKERKKLFQLVPPTKRTGSEPSSSNTNIYERIDSLLVIPEISAAESEELLLTNDSSTETINDQETGAPHPITSTPKTFFNNLSDMTILNSSNPHHHHHHHHQTSMETSLEDAQMAVGTSTTANMTTFMSAASDTAWKDPHVRVKQELMDVDDVSVMQPVVPLVTSLPSSLSDGYQHEAGMSSTSKRQNQQQPDESDLRKLWDLTAKETEFEMKLSQLRPAYEERMNRLAILGAEKVKMLTREPSSELMKSMWRITAEEQSLNAELEVLRKDINEMDYEYQQCRIAKSTLVTGRMSPNSWRM